MVAAWLAVASLAVAGALLANIALLGLGDERDDPVGKLSPRLELPAATAPAATVPTRTETVETGPRTRPDGDDDHDEPDDD